MSGQKINNYSQLDTNILEVQLTLDQTRKGLHSVSLTNYDNTSAPQIAAGSVVEVNGALYKFTANETITGSPTDGTVYIMIVPSTTTCTAEYINTAPIWSDDKQGWYGTSGTSNYRYLEYIIYKSASSYYPKEIFNMNSKNKNDLFKTNILCTFSANQTITTNEVIKFDTKFYDYNSSFNISNYTFTAPISGNYLFNIKLTTGGLSSANPTILYPKKNGSEITYQRIYLPVVMNYISGALTFVEKLNLNDAITIFMSNTGDSSFEIYKDYSSMSINLL